METNRENFSSSHLQHSSPHERLISDPLAPSAIEEADTKKFIPSGQEGVTAKVQEQHQQNNQQQISEIVRPSRKHQIDQELDQSQINNKQVKQDEAQVNPPSEPEPIVKLTKLKKNVKKGIIKKDQDDDEESFSSEEIIRKKPRGRGRTADKKNTGEVSRGRGRGKPRGRQSLKNNYPVIEEIKRELQNLPPPELEPEPIVSRVAVDSLQAHETQQWRQNESWKSTEEDYKDFQSVEGQLWSQSLIRRIDCPNYIKLQQIFEKGSVQMIGELGPTLY